MAMISPVSRGSLLGAGKQMTAGLARAAGIVFVKAVDKAFTSLEAWGDERSRRAEPLTAIAALSALQKSVGACWSARVVFGRRRRATVFIKKAARDVHRCGADDRPLSLSSHNHPCTGCTYGHQRSTSLL